ncbi:TadE/TadG family type IV pilus assembly protein [Marinovum sp.]|uniref:TadE/TadG family type IV pilus assembly protein n=1 Tax=Marinovum sp. TaxID=2024839 RepID=UPI002B2649CF|nr:TadE/TadG family type IV pilus assembly protein [Marinovum sp.]
MRRILKRVTARFCRDEGGAASTIEFAIIMPLFALFLGAMVELGWMNIRHAMLERGLDTTVREIRLATGFVPTYETIRDKICASAGIIPDCIATLRLEMKVVDPRAFTGIPDAAECQNSAEDPRPLRNFQSGEDNDIMLLRACYKFEPIFPTTGLGGSLVKDAQGFTAIVSTSAFVQEPR